MELDLRGIDPKRIDPTRVAYIHLYYDRKRKQDRLATESSNRWEARKAHLVQRALASNWDLEGKKFRDYCDQDYALTDALQAWSWHERESKRCSGVIDTELAMERMRQGGMRERPAPAPRSAPDPDPLAVRRNPGADAARGRRG